MLGISQHLHCVLVIVLTVCVLKFLFMNEMVCVLKHLCMYDGMTSVFACVCLVSIHMVGPLHVHILYIYVHLCMAFDAAFR